MLGNEESLKADESCYAYYARLETWTNEEAAALLVGLDPRAALKRESISGLRPIERERRYWELLEMINRAESAFPYRSSLDPRCVLDWAYENVLHPPEQLAEAFISLDGCRRFHMSVLSGGEITSASASRQSVAEQPEGGALHHKTRISLLKLIAGMAIRGYGFDPASGRNKAIAEIETDLRTLNIPLSDDTIRQWVGEACKLIDWETVDPSARPRNPK